MLAIKVERWSTARGPKGLEHHARRCLDFIPWAAVEQLSSRQERPRGAWRGRFSPSQSRHQPAASIL